MFSDECLEYGRIDLSEGIDVNKNKGFHKCIICHYWFFLEVNFKFQPKVCDVCHNLKQKATSFNDVAIVSVKENDYRIDFWYMRKAE